MEGRDPESNSLLDQLTTRLKGGLKPTTTKTTFADGTVQYSSFAEDSTAALNNLKGERSIGFVVDDKPDLTIGKVRSWLLVSSQDVPNDINLLKQERISCVLSLLPGFILSQECANIIEKHLILDLYDEESFTVDSLVYDKAFDFIDEARQNGKTVLIHCNAGISRAPTIVLAYLILREKLSFDKAWEELKAVRPSARPNAGFMKQLKQLV